MKQIANFSSSDGGESGASNVISKVKTARQIVNNSATLVNDNHFVFALAANKTYSLMGSLFISSGASAGFKWAFTLPSGASGTASFCTFNSATINNVDIASGSGQTASVGTSGRQIAAIISTGSTAGNVTLQWAQNAADASDTYIEKGSVITIIEV